MADELCKHDLDPATCSICLHGVSKPEGPPVSFCNSCGAEIVWVRTEKGKAMPLDIESGGDGARFKFIKGGVGIDRVHFVKDQEIQDNTDALFTSHFVTCPDRDLHRRR